MTDRVKTSVFSIVDPMIPGARVVDLFSGTGGLGIECLSRGAEHCTFVENDRGCVEIIRKNLERTHLADRSRVLTLDAWRGARELADTGRMFDLAILDPPFRMGEPPERARLVELVQLIADSLMAPGGLVVYHHEKGTPGDLGVSELPVADHRNYGRNIVTFFRAATREGGP